MAYQNGPKIVTSGLVLYLDAGNPKSYPGSGTAWTDLSGNGNNGTLTNGPTFSSNGKGSIVLDGVDDYIITNYSNNASETTFELVVNPLNVSTGASKVFLGKTGGTNNYWIGLHGTDSSIIFNPNGGLLDSDIIPNTSSFYFITATSTATQRRIYVNGDFKKLAAASSVPSPTGRLCIGVYGEELTFDTAFAISSLKVYERVLSATEILNNYNVTKGRFKL